MKIELDPTEVKAAVRGHAAGVVLPGRIGDIKKVTVHTAGGATVEFNDAPHREPPVEAKPPTVKEAETKARDKAATTTGKGKG